MNHVYVAGSINMDVIATAARYPKMGETVLLITQARQNRFPFPRRADAPEIRARITSIALPAIKKIVPIPHLAKGRVAWSGLHRDRVSPFHI
jgi:hypothetical protein